MMATPQCARALVCVTLLVATLHAPLVSSQQHCWLWGAAWVLWQPAHEQQWVHTAAAHAMPLPCAPRALPIDCHSSPPLRNQRSLHPHILRAPSSATAGLRALAQTPRSGGRARWNGARTGSEDAGTGSDWHEGARDAASKPGGHSLLPIFDGLAQCAPQFVSVEAQRLRVQRNVLVGVAALLAVVPLAVLLRGGSAPHVRGLSRGGTGEAVRIQQAPAAQADGSDDSGAAEQLGGDAGGVEPAQQDQAEPEQAQPEQQQPEQPQREQEQPQPHQERPGAAPGELECARSGYCSLGVSRTWVGDAGTNEALREAMEAISYKKEVGRSGKEDGAVGGWACVPIPLCAAVERRWSLCSITTSWGWSWW